MSRERKIELNPDDSICFNMEGGDLVGFLTSHPFFERVLSAYSYVQICNLGDVVDPPAFKYALKHLKEHKEIDIVALVFAHEAGQEIDRGLKLNKNFIEEHPVTGSSKASQLTLSRSYYLRSSLLQSKASSFNRMILGKIHSESAPNRPESVNFVRAFEDILYRPITMFHRSKCYSM